VVLEQRLLRKSINLLSELTKRLLTDSFSSLKSPFFENNFHLILPLPM
jgi:hypothetical protein